MTLIIIGFIGLLICVTMVIHEDEIRALLAKPNMVPALVSQQTQKNLAENTESNTVEATPDNTINELN